MPRAFTNKQIAVLNLLREAGALTASEIADRISRSLTCAECGGDGCKACYQRGHRFFGYSDAYAALMRLRKAGEVNRTCMLDQFGDEIRQYLWMAASQPDPDDPLEKLWALPEANHG